jgi:hypothetical protein
MVVWNQAAITPCCTSEAVLGNDAVNSAPSDDGYRA